MFFFFNKITASGEKESNVLRKVASLTYDFAMEQKQQIGSPKMRSSIDRHDLNSLENFEGITKHFCFLYYYLIFIFDYL